ncbi:uncharacterized protein METZ01_LOCUS441952, partial [marine metagenome]
TYLLLVGSIFILPLSFLLTLNQGRVNSVSNAHV